MAVELRTDRLLLRHWRQEDREPFAAMNADPRVREYFPSTLTREESDKSVDRVQKCFDEHGFGFWAVEIIGMAPFAGFIGLNVPTWTPFTPCVEIGWRLAPRFWNQGYATEGARAALSYGFDILNLAEILAFTVPTNRPSRRVMEKLSMTHDPADDFDDPALAEGHPLRRHVVYRVRATAA